MRLTGNHPLESRGKHFENIFTIKTTPIMKGVIFMKFKMTKERIDTINELLKTHGDTLTAFYDEALHQGTTKGIMAGALVGVIASNMCWVAKCIKDHKKSEEES